MGHNCKYLLIHCLDHRVIKSIVDHMGRRGMLNDCDVIGHAGGVKNLISPRVEAYRDLFWEEIGIAITGHNVQEVVISNHTDCLAYAGCAKFSSLEEERAFHKDEMRKAKAMILEKYPNVKVVMLLGIIHSSGEVELETIEE